MLTLQGNYTTRLSTATNRCHIVYFCKICSLNLRNYCYYFVHYVDLCVILVKTIFARIRFYV